MRFSLPEISHNQASFEALARLHAESDPGTVVSVEINTADTGIYVLASELSAEEIF